MDSAPNADSATTRTGPTMRAVVGERYGLDAVELRSVARPVAGPDQVLLRVHASSVNPADWYRATGPNFLRVMNRELRRPASAGLGTDVAGRVEAVGRDVTDLRPGDEVFGVAPAAWADYAWARPTRLAVMPATVSFEDAAASPVAAVTALQALRDQGRVEPGQHVLVNGASGGVGPYAV